MCLAQQKCHSGSKMSLSIAAYLVFLDCHNSGPPCYVLVAGVSDLSVCYTLVVHVWISPQPAAPELELPCSHKGGSGWRKCFYVIADLRHSSLPVIG